MPTLPRPHGGTLIDRTAAPLEAAALTARAPGLPSLSLEPDQLDELELLATGGASPLRGFLGREDHRSVLSRWRLASGLLWPWPLTLPVAAERLGRFPPGAEVALRDRAGRLRAVLTVSDAFVRDPQEEALALFDTTNPAHPGVARLLSRPSGALGGEVVALPFPADRPLAERRLSPRELRRLLSARGVSRAAALHPRGAPTRVQAYLARLALGLAEVLVIHPPASAGEAAVAAWDEVAASLPEGRGIVAALPAPDRYGSGREVLLEALVRRNYGLSQLFVVRPGDQLRPTDGLPPDIDASEVGVSILPFAAELSLPGGEGLAAAG